MNNAIPELVFYSAHSLDRADWPNLLTVDANDRSLNDFISDVTYLYPGESFDVIREEWIANKVNYAMIVYKGI